MPPGHRSFEFTVTFDALDLPTLPARYDAALTERLAVRLGEAADHVIERAQAKLVPGHGYDTGLMHDTLIRMLVVKALGQGVYYDLLSPEAVYWRWVEFGHFMVNGQWWEGYHFLEQAIVESAGHIRSKIREAFHETALAVAAEAAVLPSSAARLREPAGL